ARSLALRQCAGATMTASLTPTAPPERADPTTAARSYAIEATTRTRRTWAREVTVVVLLLLGAVAVHWGTLGDKLTERHDWRQTQTAWTATDFRDHGIDLLHPRVPVFGARSEVPFEFPIFQAVATV